MRRVPELPGGVASQDVRVRGVALEMSLPERSLTKATWPVAEGPKRLEIPKASPPGVEVTCFAEELQELPELTPEAEEKTSGSLPLAQHPYSPHRTRERS